MKEIILFLLKVFLIAIASGGFAYGFRYYDKKEYYYAGLAFTFALLMCIFVGDIYLNQHNDKPTPEVLKDETENAS